MDLDHAQSIGDLAPPTLLALSERIRRSVSEEERAYRESELDEVWRLIDCALDAARRNGETREMARLSALQKLAWDVHDIVGELVNLRMH